MDDFDRNLLPPKKFQIINYSENNFKAIGRNHLDYFVKELGLKPTDNVLEIGSGNGRIASSLTSYLESGSYIGVDIMKPFIKSKTAYFEGKLLQCRNCDKKHQCMNNPSAADRCKGAGRQVSFRLDSNRAPNYTDWMKHRVDSPRGK
jgi:tRNA A58 N-methylase Trm61